MASQRQRSSSCDILWLSTPGCSARRDSSTKPEAAPTTVAGHMVSSTLQHPFSSAKSSRVANRLWPFLLSLPNSSGWENKECLIKRPAEEKAEGWNRGKVQPGQSLISPATSWLSELWSQDLTPWPRNAFLIHPIPLSPGSPGEGSLLTRGASGRGVLESERMSQTRLSDWMHTHTHTQPHGLQPTRLLCPWDLPGKTLEQTAISFSGRSSRFKNWTWGLP